MSGPDNGMRGNLLGPPIDPRPDYDLRAEKLYPLEPSGPRWTILNGGTRRYTVEIDGEFRGKRSANDEDFYWLVEDSLLILGTWCGVRFSRESTKDKGQIRLRYGNWRQVCNESDRIGPFPGTADGQCSVYVAGGPGLFYPMIGTVSKFGLKQTPIRLDPVGSNSFRRFVLWTILSAFGFGKYGRYLDGKPADPGDIFDTTFTNEHVKASKRTRAALRKAWGGPTFAKR